MTAALVLSDLAGSVTQARELRLDCSKDGNQDLSGLPFLFCLFFGEIMKPLKTAVVVAVILAISGCATVRKQDLDAWVGVPVEALDTHSFFITVPLYRSITPSGIEIRNYANGTDVAQCFSNAGANKSGKYVNANAFTTCSSGRVVCNNIFYIKDGVVIEYAPTGSCFTNETVQPQARYLQLQNK